MVQVVIKWKKKKERKKEIAQRSKSMTKNCDD